MDVKLLEIIKLENFIKEKYLKQVIKIGLKNIYHQLYL